MFKNNKTIVYLKTPPLRELSCIIGTIDIFEKRDRSAISQFHWQILKCRMLIFSISQILVTPDIKNNRQIIIIFQRDNMNVVKLQNHLDKLKIKILISMEVSPKLFEACYKYTLQAKIAPHWNLIDVNLYLGGRNFLSSPLPTDAITLNVHVSSDYITLEILSYKLRFERMRLEDLNVIQSTLDYFHTQPNFAISETSILDQWVHVLPSLKKGRVTSVSKEIPKTSPFGCYKDLRRHWKNIYGFRLPETEENIIYYEVHFRPLGPQLYTYPSICVRPSPPLLTYPSLACGKDIADRFLNALKLQMPSLFGCPADFSQNQFNSSSIQMSNIENAPRPDTIQNVKEMSEDDLFESSCSKKENNLMSHMNSQFDITQNISLCTPTQNIHYNKDNRMQSNVITQTPKIVPKWLKKTTSSLENENKTTNKKENDNIVDDTTDNLNPNIIKPKFVSKWVKKSSSVMDNKMQSSNGKEKESISIPGDPMNYFNSNSETISLDFSSPAIQKSYPSFSLKTVNKANNGDKFIKNIIPKNVRTSLIIKPPSSGWALSNEVNSKRPNTPSFSRTVTPTLPCSQESFPSSSQVSAKGKRKATASDKQSTPSKPKRAPIDLSALDIPALVARDPEGLNKLTCQILLAWLKSQNIPANSRNTKKQLLEKVYNKVKGSNI